MSEPTEGPAIAAPSPPRRRRILAVAVALYCVGIVLVWALLRFRADIWWPATLILFGPRWIWGVPLVVLVPLSVVRARLLLVPLALAALVFAVPILGFTVALPGRLANAPPTSDDAPQRRLRVMTYNVGEDTLDGADLFRVIGEVEPDVVAIQECRTVARVGQRRPGVTYFLIAGNDLCLASRFPIERLAAPAPEVIRGIGGTGSFVRYVVHHPAGDVQLVNVHLATVREGLGAVLQRGLAGVPALKENLATRWAMSALARAEVDAAGAPVLVMGDFNMPTDSAIYRRDWADLTNAFSTAGNGFGDTKRTRWFGIRIDHVLVGAGWTCERAFIGPHLAGDHRPIVADLAWSK